MTSDAHPATSVTVALTINGTEVQADVEPRMLLVELLRDELGLTGTHIGCESTSCGACTVHVDGRSVKSCTVLAFQARGAEVTTIEGLSEGGDHPVQAAFTRRHALQCGFCTPGMVMAAVSAIDEGRTTDEADTRRAIKGNLCRCTGYQNIVSAIRDATPGPAAP